ncbi:hypothetical protein OG21DRAFT_1490720 [Imleria badia]|nr:hypothetical protein OG21DRAFT_1490720 [Imleria badia]
MDRALVDGCPYQPPAQGTPFGYDHHLAFFHPRHSAPMAPKLISVSECTDLDTLQYLHTRISLFGTAPFDLFEERGCMIR